MGVLGLLIMEQRVLWLWRDQVGGSYGLCCPMGEEMYQLHDGPRLIVMEK